ncbi:MAG: hypothetical protein ACJLS2_14765 [Microcella pacifica]
MLVGRVALVDRAGGRREFRAGDAFVVPAASRARGRLSSRPANTSWPCDERAGHAPDHDGR